MTYSRTASGRLLILVALLPLSTTAPSTFRPSSLCTLMPGTTLALVQIEKDTTLPFVPPRLDVMSLSQLGGDDSLVATASTQMPAAKVRLLQTDSTTRAVLTNSRVAEKEPIAILRAAPYRHDCRIIRWTDSVPFVRRGERGYVRGTLAPREQWIGGIPVIVIPNTWNYPYPHRRGLVFGVDANEPLASAEAMFSLSIRLHVPEASRTEHAVVDSMRRDRALAWAREHTSAAELEPVRTIVREAVLEPDWEAAEQKRSRLRGTYRVVMEVGGEKITWFFRTHDRPGYNWRGADSLRSTVDVLASPFVSGYLLVGRAASSPAALPESDLSRGSVRDMPLVWLATDDRPTAPQNASRQALRGVLEFNMAAAAEATWDVLELLVPRQSPEDSALHAQIHLAIPRGEQQPRIPLALRLTPAGGVQADTTLLVGGHTLRIRLERLDTVSVPRPF